jgi:hypothetical protein
MMRYRELRNRLLHASAGRRLNKAGYRALCSDLLGRASVSEFIAILEEGGRPPLTGLIGLAVAQSSIPHPLSSIATCSWTDKRARGGALWVALPAGALPEPGRSIAGFTRPAGARALKRHPDAVYTKAAGDAEELVRTLALAAWQRVVPTA